MNVRNSYHSPSGNNYKSIDMEAFYVLAKEFNISLEWLFFGIGNMIKNLRRKLEESKNAQVQD